MAFAWPCAGVAQTLEVSHVGGAPNYKIKFGLHPHDGRMEAAWRQHEGCRRKFRFSPASGRQGMHSGCIPEVAFMLLHQTMWPPCVQCEGCVSRHAVDRL